MEEIAKKTAIVLFNLGGPKKSEDVRGFLYNLFSDPQIIRLPAILRKPLAWVAARRRYREAQKKYNFLGGGGGSPLLENTKAQARALERILAQKSEEKKVFKVFISMRYWHPFAAEAIDEIKTFAPDEIVLLPLYPQYSTTTTESSFRDWRDFCQKAKLKVSTKAVCCWADHRDFIAAHADLLRARMEANDLKKFHILFSAHGIPERIVRSGDPYQKQTELTALEIAQAAGLDADQWSLAYQSRVGPLAWIGPETGSEIRRLSRKVKTLFLVPISFVSEHVETLVDLDIEFGAIAKSSALENYIRVPALGTHEKFIACLADLVKRGSGQQDEKLLCPEHIPGAPCTDIFSDG